MSLAAGAAQATPGGAAANVPLPDLKTGDTWVYKNTIEQGTGSRILHTQADVERVTSTSILLSAKEVGSTQTPRETLSGRDWSRFRTINGVETVVNRPLSFPLQIGKTWMVDYVETNPNPIHAREHFHVVYTVTGWEPVAVGDTNYQALKVEAEGTWDAIIAATAGTATRSSIGPNGVAAVAAAGHTPERPTAGRLYREILYVPELKRWARSVDESYDSNGVRFQRFTDDLESFTPGK